MAKDAAGDLGLVGIERRIWWSEHTPASVNGPRPTTTATGRFCPWRNMEFFRATFLLAGPRTLELATPYMTPRVGGHLARAMTSDNESPQNHLILRRTRHGGPSSSAPRFDGLTPKTKPTRSSPRSWPAAKVVMCCHRAIRPVKPPRKLPWRPTPPPAVLMFIDWPRPFRPSSSHRNNSSNTSASCNFSRSANSLT
jgi:hypothetical protein